MKHWLADVTKWIVVIAVAATAFYLVYPKYYYVNPQLTERQAAFLGLAEDRWRTGIMRYNRTTGKGTLIIINLCKFKKGTEK